MEVLVSNFMSTGGRGPPVDMKSMIEKTVKTICRKKSNIVVSNIQDTGSENHDSALFVTLCENYMNIRPSIVKSVRLGRLGTGSLTAAITHSRPRLLLVTLSSETEVTNVMRVAKLLRNASDTFVGSNVYISRDLTKSEAKEQYDKRVAKRLLLADHARPVHSTSMLSSRAAVFTPLPAVLPTVLPPTDTSWSVSSSAVVNSVTIAGTGQPLLANIGNNTSLSDGRPGL